MNSFLRALKKNAIAVFMMVLVLGMGQRSWGQTNNYFGTSGTISGSVWSTNVAGPYTSALNTTGGAIINFGNTVTAITGGSITVAGINATANVPTMTAGGTISNFSNGVIIIDVSSGKTLDFGSQSFTSSATAGYIKNNSGVLAFAGNTYGGGFTLNNGTVIIRGVNAMGAASTLTLNGGTLAANATRDLTGKYTGGITIGGDVQFGEVPANVALASNTANLTFTNNIALGSAVRTLTLGNAATYTLSGVFSGTGGINYSANANGASGVFAISTSNTYTGKTTLSGGIVSASGESAFGANPSSLVADQITFNGGTLQLSGNIAFSSNRGITLGSGGGTFNTNGNTLSFATTNPIAGAGAFTKTGTGTATLSGANTYTGLTTISGGTLQLGRTGGTTIPSTNDVTVSSGGTLRISSTQTLNNLTVSSGGALTVDAGVTLTINGTFNHNGGTITAGSTIAYGSSGTLSYGGSTQQTLNALEWPTTSGPVNIIINNSAGFRFNSSRTVSGNFTVQSGDVQNNSGSGSTLTLTGATPTLSVAGSITGTGVGAGNDINLTYTNTSGTLIISGAGSLCRFLSVTNTNTASTIALTRNLSLPFGAFTENGILQMNGGGSITMGTTPSVTYGASSKLIYNSATYTTTTNEFPASGVKNVDITAPSGTSTVTLDGDKVITGTLAVGTNTLNGGKSMNAATITIGTGSMVMGDLTTSSAFTCSGASSISLTGAWSVTGFTKSTSTVTFAGTGSINNATSFYNVTNSAGTRSITQNIDVENTLLVSGGQMGVTGGTGKSLTMSGAAATINIAGGSIFGTDAGTGNDLSLIVSGTQTTLTGNATASLDDEKKFFNVTVNTGSTLALARGILCKYGTFTVNGTIQINTNGYVQNDATYGANAKLPAYNAATGALIYNNGGPFTNAGEWPSSSSPFGVTVQNGSSVTLSGNRTVAGVLTLTSGSLAVAGNTLTLNGGPIIIGTGTLVTTSSSSLIFGGSTSGVSVPSSVAALNNLTINNTSGVTLSSAITMAGNFNIGTSSFANLGTFTHSAGTLTLATKGTAGGKSFGSTASTADIKNNTYFSSLATGKVNVSTGSCSAISANLATTGTTPICNGSSSTIAAAITGGVSPYTLVYSTGTANAYVSGTNITVSPVSTTGYTMTSVTDAYGCTAATLTGTATVSVNANPTASFSKIPVSTCGGGTDGAITLTALTGASPFTYSNDNGSNYFAGNTFTNLAAGDYQLKVKDANNCTVLIPDVTVTTAGALSAGASKTDPGSCAGNDGTITANRVGGVNDGITAIQFKLDKNGSSYIGYQTSGTFTGLSAGSYVVTVKDSRGCTGVSTTLTLTAAAPLAVSAAGSYKTNVSGCGGGIDGSITTSVTGGITPYHFILNGVEKTVTSLSTYTFTGLNATTAYTVNVTDAKGCSIPAQTPVTLSNAGLPTATLYRKGDVTCIGGNNGFITVQTTGIGGIAPYSFSSNGGSTYQSSYRFLNLVAGNYPIKIKDAKNCVSTNSLTVTIGPGIACLAANSVAGTSVTATSATIKVKASPNPTTSTFTLQLTSSSREKVTINVTDMFGNCQYTTTGTASQAYKFGKNFVPGVYLVQVMQGKDVQTLKVIKQ